MWSVSASVKGERQTPYSISQIEPIIIGNSYNNHHNILLHKDENTKWLMFGMRENICTWHCLGLTFACLNAVKPPVISVSAAGTSAVLEPSATRSATTEFSGFLDGSAFETQGSRRRHYWC